MASSTKVPYSSLPFQIMITVSETYLPAMFLVTLGSLIYKGALLPYPPVILVLEMALVLLLPLMESSRLFFACRANLTESFPSLLLFFGMTLILPVMSVFFMAWQTYVLAIDVAIHGIGLGIVGVQLLAAVHYLICLIRRRR